MNEFRLTMSKIKEKMKLVSNTITNLLMQLIFLNWIIILRQMGAFSNYSFQNKRISIIVLLYLLQMFGGVNVYECD